MGTSTPAEFAAKLRRVPAAVAGQSGKGIEARAFVTKRFILAAAMSSRRYGKVQPSWVRYRILNGVAEVRLRGGFAHLSELGSYKQPDGWDETPRTLSARRRARGGVQAAALNTPYGPRASVHHPPLRRREFWRRGLDASRIPGHQAYRKVVVGTITEVLR